MPANPRAVDAWINPNPPAVVGASRNVDYLFKDLAALRARGTTLEQLIDEMDEAGVERGLLCAGYGAEDDRPWVCQAIERHPDRFAGSLVVNPKRGMDAVREVERFARDHGFRMVRFLAFDTQLPYDHAAYYPVYAKCVELGLVVGVNVGIPGPRVPGKHQHPLALDEVCYFFPELKIVMSHGGDPWADLCVKLMLKWENLYYMSSAFAPKHIPPEVVKYMNTRGVDKVMWASDYPLLSFQRCMDEVRAMPFRDEARREKFVRTNALKLFFPEAAPQEA